MAEKSTAHVRRSRSLCLSKHRTPKGAARLSALTDAALEMFLDQGYEAVSLDTLISRVGGSRRNIYCHFGGKEGLFLAAITAMCERLAEPIKSARIPLSGDPAAALLRFGRMLLKTVLLPRTLDLKRLMVAEASRFPDLAQTIWTAGHQQAAIVLAGWMAQQQSAGVLRKGRPPLLLARQFVDLVVTDAQLRAQIGIPAAFDHDVTLSAAIETFLQGQASRRDQRAAGPDKSQEACKSRRHGRPRNDGIIKL